MSFFFDANDAPAGLAVVAPLPDDRFRILATADDAPEPPSAEFIQSLPARTIDHFAIRTRPESNS